MKNYFILLLSSLFLISCSNENSSNNPETPEGTILKSYLYSNDPDGNEHIFENNGTRYDKIIRDSETYTKFLYDSDNKMTQIIYFPNSPSSYSYTFSYNDKGQIVKMVEDKRNVGLDRKIITWLYTYQDNVIIGELVSDVNPNLSYPRFRYTFNDNGLLISKHDYYDSPYFNETIVTNSYLTLKYDDQNKNVISMKRTENATHDLSDSPINTKFISMTFEYDDKTNPIHQIYMNHYLNYILSDEYPFNLENPTQQDRVLGSGANNLTRTTYANDPWTGGIAVDNDYVNKFTYQLNDLPKRRGRVSTTYNAEHGFITYNYVTK